MAPTTLSVTVTATVTPPLDSDLARQVGVELAALTNGELVSTGDDDRGWHSWQFALDHDPDALDRLGLRASDLERRLVNSLPAAHDVQITSLEALTMAEVERRLATHGVPARGAVRSRRPAPEVPEAPETVTTAQFAELLEVDVSRVRQLRAEREHALDRDEPHPFPAEYVPGRWTKDAALHYLEHGRRRAGRPRKANAGNTSPADDDL